MKNILNSYNALIERNKNEKYIELEKIFDNFQLDLKNKKIYKNYEITHFNKNTYIIYLNNSNEEDFELTQLYINIDKNKKTNIIEIIMKKVFLENETKTKVIYSIKKDNIKITIQVEEKDKIPSTTSIEVSNKIEHYRSRFFENKTNNIFFDNSYIFFQKINKIEDEDLIEGIMDFMLLKKELNENFKNLYLLIADLNLNAECEEMLKININDIIIIE